MAQQQFSDFIQKNGINIKIITSDKPTHTAQQAANAHHVPVSAIVKSILIKVDNVFQLHLVPGDKKIDLTSLKQKNNATEVRLATPDEVKIITGYSIGGVPPFGHHQPIPTYIADGFPTEGVIIPAAGANNACFKTTLSELERLIHTE